MEIGYTRRKPRGHESGNGTKMKRRNTLSMAIFATMCAVFVYGAIHFFDAPYRPCPEHGYCNKFGEARTESEFLAFSRWGNTFMLVWPLGMLTLFLLNRRRK